MKTGIVKIPEWAKEAFNHVESVQLRCGGGVGMGIIHLDGAEVVIDGMTKNREWNATVKNKFIIQIPESWIEIQETKIDWSRVKVDAPVEVFCNGKSEWKNAHLAKVTDDGRVVVWVDGKTSYTTANLDWSVTEARFPQGVNPEDYYV